MRYFVPRPARRANQMRAVMMFERRAREAEEHSSVIRKVLLSAEKGDIGEPVWQTAND